MSVMPRPRWLEPGDEWNWREGRIVAEDLAAFVPVEDRHRALTVVREVGDRDLAAQSRQWLDKVRADAADIDACEAMRRAVERWADGSREGQKRGAIAVVRLDERGHRGLAAALDELWSVRATDTRDFWRLVKFARGCILAAPSRPTAARCRCDGLKVATLNVGSGIPAVAPVTRAGLAGILRTVLTATGEDRAGKLRWATRKLQDQVRAGHLPAETARNLVHQLAAEGRPGGGARG